MTTKLTPKQEKAVQVYLSTGNKTEAYRQAYNVGKMKETTISRKAVELFETGTMSAKVEAEKLQTLKRNHATIDELLSLMASALRADPADFFDVNGNLLPMNQIPKHLRQTISDFVVEHKPGGLFGDVTTVTRVKFIPKGPLMDQFMKHFGAYATQQIKIEHTTPLMERISDQEAEEINNTLELKY